MNIGMELTELFPLLLVVAAGAYTQTVTGFAMGLIVMGAATVLELAPIAFTAIVVSITSLLNIVLSLRGHLHEVDRRLTALAGAPVVPATVAGVLLLDYLSSNAVATLRDLLGLFILAGGFLLMLRPHPRARRAPAYRAAVMGTLGGLFGGMFSTAGPPLVYHLYREPVSVAVVRVTLLAIFAVVTAVRILWVGVEGQLQAPVLYASALCIPVVYVATVGGRRYRPPLSDTAMRRLAFGLLALIGLALLLT